MMEWEWIIVVVLGGILVCGAGLISLAWTGCWRAPVRAGAGSRASFSYYDGGLPGDGAVQSELCQLDLYSPADASRPDRVVGYVHGGMWHRGHRSSWMYTGELP